MALGDIFKIIGNLTAWWTPEQVKARAKDKLERLKDERKKILQQPASLKNVKRLNDIDDSIDKLQDYLSNH